MQFNINIVFLLLFNLFALYAIFYQNSSVFFVVYLFWFDELIRSISIFIQLKICNETAFKNPEFTKPIALINVKVRFFFLFIYSVFIVIVYGLFFHLSSEKTDILGENIQIFTFGDISFNICLMIAFSREILQIRITHINRGRALMEFDAMSGNMLTLHLSIIFGAFLWAITSGKFQALHLNFGLLNGFAYIIPFFIIKFWVEIYQLNKIKKVEIL